MYPRTMMRFLIAIYCTVYTLCIVNSHIHRFYTRIDHQSLSGCHKHRCSQPCIWSTREIGDGWPLLTVETVVNGNSKRTNERGPFLVGSLGLSCRYKRFLFCHSCSVVSSVQTIFFLTLRYFNNCLHRPASGSGSRAGSPVFLV
jgi:hypothetical protein